MESENKTSDWLMSGGGYNDNGTFSAGKLNVKEAVRIGAKPFGLMTVYCDGHVMTQFLEINEGWHKDELEKEMNIIANDLNKKR